MNMKLQTLIGSLLAAGLLAGCASEHCCCHRHDSAERQAKLLAQTRVTKDAAQQTALAQVPNGQVKSGELEKEHGRVIWSFDVTTPDTSDITEVNVDAITGAVISTDKESAAGEAKEKD